MNRIERTTLYRGKSGIPWYPPSKTIQVLPVVPPLAGGFRAQAPPPRPRRIDAGFSLITLLTKAGAAARPALRRAGKRPAKGGILSAIRLFVFRASARPVAGRRGE